MQNLAQWFDIKTAPKDGTRILAYTNQGRFENGYFAVTWWRQKKDKARFIGWGEFDSSSFPATHWMPLPDKPNAKVHADLNDS